MINAKSLLSLIEEINHSVNKESSQASGASLQLQATPSQPQADISQVQAAPSQPQVDVSQVQAAPSQPQADMSQVQITPSQLQADTSQVQTNFFQSQKANNSTDSVIGGCLNKKTTWLILITGFEDKIDDLCNEIEKRFPNINIDLDGEYLVVCCGLDISNVLKDILNKLSIPLDNLVFNKNELKSKVKLNPRDSAINLMEFFTRCLGGENKEESKNEVYNPQTKSAISLMNKLI